MSTNIFKEAYERGMKHMADKGDEITQMCIDYLTKKFLVDLETGYYGNLLRIHADSDYRLFCSLTDKGWTSVMDHFLKQDIKMTHKFSDGVFITHIKTTYFVEIDWEYNTRETTTTK